MIRIGICDDDALVRQLLVDELNSHEDIEVMVACSSGREALVSQVAADVWLLDIRMPGIDGLQTCRQLRAHPHPPQVILMTSFATEAVEDGLRAGAAGYIFKDGRPEALAHAVRTAHAGLTVTSPEAIRTLGNPRVSTMIDLLARDDIDRQILTRVVRGENYDVIARKVGLSQSGVKKRMRSLEDSAGVSTRAELTGYLLRSSGGLDRR